MKNYFKKFSIMFVMALMLVLGCSVSVFADDGVVGNSNLNNTSENSAKVGDKLTAPEIGWKRYNDTNKNIQYSTDFLSGGDRTSYYSDWHYIPSTANGSINFKFYGTKLRIISAVYSTYSNKIQITIDGTIENYTETNPKEITQMLVYEKTALPLGIHTVSINKINNGSYRHDFHLDAIDIDKDGYLVNPNESISLDKSTDNIQVWQTDNLTVTTTPAGAEIVWSSSDETIATVDSTGKVTALKEGQATITAQIKGSETKASCTVTVTKSGTITPTEPTTDDGSLFIEMVDGNVKQAQNADVADFIKWFKNRDLDHTDNPIYKIKNAKGNVEYLVHDKVVGFEIR